MHVLRSASHKPFLRRSLTNHHIHAIHRFLTATTTSAVRPGQLEVTSASVVDKGKGLILQFSENESSLFHAPWLWSNEPSSIHPTSGQRTRSISTCFGWKIESARLLSHWKVEQIQGKKTVAIPPGCFHPIGTVYEASQDSQAEHLRSNQAVPYLQVEWKHERRNEQFASFFDVQWLLECRYDQQALNQRRLQQEITTTQALQFDSQPTLVDFDEWITQPDDAALQILDGVFQNGAALMTNVPHHQHLSGSIMESVGEIGKSLASGGSLSHGSLYGDIFHVQAEPGALNIASTNLGLAAHQDLAYYESKPGLQLLHCVKNRGVQGGMSLLIDAMAAALTLKDLAPDLYGVLLECEATFVKQRMNADMVFRMPHIEEDSNGSVIRVSWSPPFEGPMSVKPSLLNDYVAAYSAFERMLDKNLPKDEFYLPLPQSLEKALIDYAHQYSWERQLEEGDVLIFSNQRMLHGRSAFEIAGNDPQNGRHLVGCYTNIDDTLCRYRLLRRRQVQNYETTPHVPFAGNGSA